jgi:hypothetical protein
MAIKLIEKQVLSSEELIKELLHYCIIYSKLHLVENKNDSIKSDIDYKKSKEILIKENNLISQLLKSKYLDLCKSSPKNYLIEVEI